MAKHRILVVDDDELMLQLCQSVLRQLPEVELILESDSRRAAGLLASETFDLLLTDLRMPGKSGLELLQEGRQADPQLTVIIMTGYPSVDNAVECMKQGAVDYLVKPFSNAELLKNVTARLESRRLRDENRLLRRQMERSYCCGDILAQSSVMQKVCETIRRASETNFEVLIVGETGTGKELVARSIHKQSSRREGPFVPVNCGAIPEELMEREFFGNERGAFTGAQTRSLGLLEYAHGGTFFLDELNQFPPRLQGKLLRVLQEHKLRRVGGNQEIDFDVRIIGASSVSLDEEVKQGRFRPDLFHRLNVVKVDLPPLRDRAEDIPLLLSRFLERYCAELKRPPLVLSPEVLEVFQTYSWPGNVRELQNALKRALAMAKSETINLEDLPEEIVTHAGESYLSGSNGGAGFFAERERHMVRFERDYFTELLRACEGEASAAARQARIPRGTLYRLLKKHCLNPSDFRAARLNPGGPEAPALDGSWSGHA
jgi:DNA-binding NtrC family response regulator